MANYVIKEMPTGMGNGSEGKTFPKMQVYTLILYFDIFVQIPLLVN